MLHLHHANRPETLATALASLLRTDPLPLLESEQVVVPSGAVARWLDFHLAGALGVAVRTAFPFPAAYAWQLFGRILPEVGGESPFDREAMQWRLLRLLGDSRAPEIRHYLSDDDGSRQHALAGRLASLFDRYLVERPDWLAAWRTGQQIGLGADEGWQAALWQALVAELPGVAHAHPRDRFLAALHRDPALRARLPRRISLFCVEAMPALYWSVFVELAAWLELHVFVLSPCREYWGDLERARTRLRLEIEQPEAAMLYETGHPLLASLGRARQHAVVRLAEAATEVPTVEHESFVLPPASLLGRLQRDILDLQSSTGIPPDASLQIHDCHGALREAEVLHDRLLDLFETLPDLQPGDILVLTPDIDATAPALEAVLTHAPLSRRIPCTVADRPLAAAPLWRAVRRLCAVAGGELDAESVMSLLDEPALRRAFGLAESHLPRLRDWVGEAAIRWGIDGTARRARGLPDDGEAFSWRAGLQRLLLGVAMPDSPARLWQGRLPVAGIEGERAERLGSFIDFTDALFELSGKLGAGRTAGQWCQILRAALDRFFSRTEEEEASFQEVRAALAWIEAHAERAACRVRLPLATLLGDIDTRMVRQASARAFQSGKLTIAALQPGRPLPARVVCLVGMNDGAWPRPAMPVGFDLISRYPRVGDRQVRHEERNAFLETLLCATDAVIVTYSGRDPQGNLVRPPAAPLGELLDTLSAMTGLPAPSLVIQHPLQPFGRAYFDGVDSRLFSYDHPATGVDKNKKPDNSNKVAVLNCQINKEVIEVDDLLRFLTNPTRYFYRVCLGVDLDKVETRLETCEPFVADRLQSYHLRAAQFLGRVQGEPVAEILRARGWLPVGVAGELVERQARDEADTLFERARPWCEARPLDPVDFEFEAGGEKMRGKLSGLSNIGLYRVRYGKLRGIDRLRLWVEHLLLHLVRPSGVPVQSTLIALDSTFTLPVVPHAADHLADLLAIYRDGVRQVLPFYPETSWAWLAKKDYWRAWAGDAYRGIAGERDDPYVRLALRDGDRTSAPLAEEFFALAAKIYQPLRMAQAGGDD